MIRAKKRHAHNRTQQSCHNQEAWQLDLSHGLQMLHRSLMVQRSVAPIITFVLL